MKIGMGREGLHSPAGIVSVLAMGAAAAKTPVILQASICESIPPLEKPEV
jgi:hypothetical protein